MKDTITAFQGMHQHETYICHYYRHWVKLLPPLLLLVGSNIAILFGLYSIISTENTVMRHLLLWIFAVGFIISHVNFFRQFYKRCLYVVIVTDKRVHRIRKTLMTMDDHQSIDIGSLQDIKKTRHGIMQNIINYGEITLEAQETVLKLRYVPNPGEIQKQIMHLTERLRATRNGANATT